MRVNNANNTPNFKARYSIVSDMNRWTDVVGSINKAKAVSDSILGACRLHDIPTLTETYISSTRQFEMPFITTQPHIDEFRKSGESIAEFAEKGHTLDLDDVYTAVSEGRFDFEQGIISKNPSLLH